LEAWKSLMIRGLNKLMRSRLRWHSFRRHRRIYATNPW